MTARAASWRGWATSGLVWGFAVAALLTLWILLHLGGGDYYRTPLRVRAYAPAHRLLRPSGPAGQTFGLIGTVLMLVPFAYMVRKRIRNANRIGSVKGWLEVHLFCGVVGPVLVTFHTSFKFNGIVSAAYWSMVVVMLSGFAGRYLYVRIPRSIRGNEMTRADLDARIAELKEELARSTVSAAVTARVEQLEAQVAPSRPRTLFDFLFGELALTRTLRAFDRDLAGHGVPGDLRRQVAGLAAERAVLLARAADLQRTKKLFQAWHVLHLPLVYLLLVIAIAHIGLVLYMGYVPFRW